MPVYDTSGSDGSFSYQVQYTQQPSGWSLDGVKVMRGADMIFSQSIATNFYRTEAVAIAYGINRCEAFVSAFTLGGISWDEFKHSHGQLP
ncbi:hypothetical protein [Herbaspirillum sp. alder98]|uniref:hypothetical protein n=1 Tax=Herbaspirillum sp. alder98 TaxID=2913096 RepID=UPI001CD8F660|nr:hypothetical protein [Herbaspirillum sp. alder98]MCA1322872.1 hypothetical protein [Herbaspirillum sp. alder98]